MGFFSRRRSVPATGPAGGPAGAGPAGPRSATSKYGIGGTNDRRGVNWADQVVECVAGHFPGGARVDGQVVDTGLRRPGDTDSVHLHVSLHQLSEFGASSYMSSVFFRVWGGPFGPEAMFASASGYGSSEAEAVVVGACNWCCTFRPLAQIACGLPPSSESGTVADRTIERPDGRSYRLVHDGWTRVMSAGESDPGVGRRVLDQLAGEGCDLTPLVAASDLLPDLARDHVTLLSTFVMETPAGRTVEIKVDGEDHELAAGTLFRREGESLAGDSFVLIRELAVLMPQ